MKRYNGNKKSPTYTKFIGILSHLIYTKPLAVKSLLNEYGVGIDGIPTYKELISATVELLSQQDKGFESDLGELVSLHVKKNADELMEYDEDSFLGGLIGGLAKGLIGGIGGIFKKKRRPRHVPTPVVANVKNDMAQQMARIRADQERKEALRRAERERKEEERRRRKEEKEEQERRERKEEQKAKEAASAKQTKMIMMVVGGVVILGAAVMLLKPKPVPVAPR